MNSIIISGSSRAGSQSLKVANWMRQALVDLDHTAEIIDLHAVNLPLIHEDIWDEIDTSPTGMRMREKLEAADGYVIIAPEWNGMVAPGLKNFFVYVKHTMAHKPAYLVGISSTHGGANPILEMRLNTAKNTRICYTPEHLIIRDVESMLNQAGTESNNTDDEYIKKRAVYGLTQLAAYAEALQHVRSSGVIDFGTYPNGMS